ncbi:hypothetical protein [uncultured Desulfuromonas sp.]|uniref:hypothetical protein n=1 Tax=uncultured Desulfuromonas sp. TaxID=181013 RepID=UPI002616710E|nr:hypothetical protein [uncultured Desulfuromonas sp.]
MKAENIISNPVKKTYKYSVYGTFAFVGISLSAFILWSFTCLGSAAFDVASKLA